MAICAIADVTKYAPHSSIGDVRGISVWPELKIARVLISTVACVLLHTTPSREVHGRLWDHDFAPRNPQRISAKEMRPDGPDEYAKILIVFSWKTVPCAVPAPSGMVSLPAPQMAASR